MESQNSVAWKKFYVQLAVFFIIAFLSVLPIIVVFLNIWETPEGKMALFPLFFNSLRNGSGAMLIVKGICLLGGIVFFITALKNVFVAVSMFNMFFLQKAKLLEEIESGESSLEEFSMTIAGLSGSMTGSAGVFILPLIIASMIGFLSFMGESCVNLLFLSAPIKILFYMLIAQFLVSIVALVFVGKKNINKHVIIFNACLLVVSFILMQITLNGNNFSLYLPALDNNPEYVFTLFGNSMSSQSLFYISENGSIFSYVGEIEVSKIAFLIPAAFVLLSFVDICLRMMSMSNNWVIIPPRKDGKKVEKYDFEKKHFLIYLIPIIIYFAINIFAYAQELDTVSIVFSPTYTIFIVFAIICSIALSYVFKKISSKKSN